jgi:hypothetical protein
MKHGSKRTRKRSVVASSPYTGHAFDANSALARDHLFSVIW